MFLNVDALDKSPHSRFIFVVAVVGLEPFIDFVTVFLQQGEGNSKMFNHDLSCVELHALLDSNIIGGHRRVEGS